MPIIVAAIVLAMFAGGSLISEANHARSDGINIDGESELGAVCSGAIKSALENNSDERMVSVQFHARKNRSADRETATFITLMKTQQGVPSRYSGTCEIAPDKTAIIHLETAESFGRF